MQIGANIIMHDMWKHASVIMQIPKDVNKNIFPNSIMA